MAEKRAPNVTIHLRLSPSLHKRLTQAAKRGDTSLHGEIIDRLESSFDPRRELAAKAEDLATASFYFMEGLKIAGIETPSMRTTIVRSPQDLEAALRRVGSKAPDASGDETVEAPTRAFEKTKPK